MNLTDIHLYTPVDGSNTPIKQFEFPLTNPKRTDSYIIKSVTGLDVDEITPTFFKSPSTSVITYNRMSLPSRSVSILIRLNPQYHLSETPMSLRSNLQKLISANRSGLTELRFMNGVNAIANLYGRISKFESSIFTAENEVQITFECDQPFLKSLDYITVSTPSVPNPTIIDSVSSAPHGFEFSITFTGNASPLTIESVDGVAGMDFTIGTYFNEDDVLNFSSEHGNKYIHVYRGVEPLVQLNLMDEILSPYVWPVMFPGTTTLGFSSSNFTWNYFRYKHHFWGV